MPIPTDWLANFVFFINKAHPGDLLICNESQIRHSRHNLAIARKFNGVRILLIRNLVEADFIETVKPCFDLIYSFDAGQCETYGIHFLDQYLPFDLEEIDHLNNAPQYNHAHPVCFFIGKDKGRIERIASIGKTLQAYGAQTTFYVIRDDTSQSDSEYYVESVLPYDVVMEKTLAADILIEFAAANQEGITMRALEAAFFSKKLLTDNASIKQFDFYSKKNIYVIGTDDANELEGFLQQAPEKTDRRILYRYTPQCMIEKIMQDASCLRRLAQ